MIGGAVRCGRRARCGGEIVAHHHVILGGLVTRRRQGDRPGHLVGRAIAVVLLASAMPWNGALPAQATVATGLLTLPTGEALLCKARTPSARDAANGAMLDLTVEARKPIDAGNRTDEATFDSTGHVLTLIEIIGSPLGRAETSMEAVTVRFLPTGQAAGRVMRYRMSTDARPSRDMATLTASQLGDARTLARWMWDHRCPVRGGATPARGGTADRAPR